MKKGILFLLIIGGLTASAQEPTKKPESLRDLLYSGKLKKDSSGVVRKTDDLSTKIDTTTKKVVDTPKTVPTKTVAPPTKTATNTGDAPTNIAGDAAVVTTTAAETKTTTKSNTKIWKEYTDHIIPILTSEVLPNKKIKKGTYYIFVECELDVDGKVNILNVTSTPESDMLVAQTKLKLETDLPPLHAEPNQTKKLKKKYSFNITKD